MVAFLVAAVVFVAVSLAVIVCHKAGQVCRSTQEDTVAVNPAYGVARMLEDAHTPGESAYDYPTINIHTYETRISEAYGIVYETIAAGHGDSIETYSHPVEGFQAGSDDNIETKQNEVYAVIAGNTVMEKI